MVSAIVGRVGTTTLTFGDFSKTSVLDMALIVMDCGLKPLSTGLGRFSFHGSWGWRGAGSWGCGRRESCEIVSDPAAIRVKD